MARYIDADKMREEWLENGENEYVYDTNSVLDSIDAQPTADVVEVVRCKECKHCELRYPAKAIGEEAIEGYYCHLNQRYVKSTDFCNYGERRRVMAELCSYDEAYDIYDAEEIGWCVRCKCDKNCPMYNKLHTRTPKERD